MRRRRKRQGKKRNEKQKMVFLKKKKQLNKQAVNTKRGTKERECTNKEERCRKMDERKK